MSGDMLASNMFFFKQQESHTLPCSSFAEQAQWRQTPKELWFLPIQNILKLSVAGSYSAKSHNAQTIPCTLPLLNSN